MLLGAVLFFVGVVFPILGLINALTNERLSDSKKIVWSVVCVAFGPLGAALYFMFHAKNKFFSYAAVPVAIVSLGAGIVTVVLPVKMKTYALKNIRTFSEKNANFEAGISAGEIENLQKNTSTLRRELNDVAWHSPNLIYKRHSLTKSLVEMSVDGTITAAELREWNRQFSLREEL